MYINIKHISYWCHSDRFGMIYNCSNWLLISSRVDHTTRMERWKQTNKWTNYSGQRSEFNKFTRQCHYLHNTNQHSGWAGFSSIWGIFRICLPHSGFDSWKACNVCFAQLWVDGATDIVHGHCISCHLDVREMLFWRWELSSFVSPPRWPREMAAGGGGKTIAGKIPSTVSGIVLIGRYKRMFGANN